MNQSTKSDSKTDRLFRAGGWIGFWLLLVFLTTKIYLNASSFRSVNAKQQELEELKDLEKQLADDSRTAYVVEEKYRWKVQALERAMSRTQGLSDFPVRSGDAICTWGHLLLPELPAMKKPLRSSIGFKSIAYFPEGEHEIEYYIIELNLRRYNVLSRASLATIEQSRNIQYMHFQAVGDSKRKNILRWPDGNMNGAESTEPTSDAEKKKQVLKPGLKFTLAGGQVYEFQLDIPSDKPGTLEDGFDFRVADPNVARFKVIDQNGNVVHKHEHKLEGCTSARYQMGKLELAESKLGRMNAEESIGLNRHTFPVNFFLPNELKFGNEIYPRRQHSTGYLEIRFEPVHDLIPRTHFELAGIGTLRVDLVRRNSTSQLQINPVDFAGQYGEFMRPWKMGTLRYHNRLNELLEDSENPTKPLSELIQPYDGSGIYHMKSERPSD